MPFGAHETMEAHEILSESINMISHFAFYAQQCQDQQLRDMLNRHMQTSIDSYNNLLTYTHTYHVSPMQPASMQQISPEQIKYGLRNPSNESPQLSGQSFSDKQIAQAMLSFHKCSAKNNMAAALECADPYVRECMTNSAVTCANFAYETFNLMNQKGWYQVPTMDPQTAKTMLHHYQPAQGQMMQQGQLNQGQLNQGQNYQGYQTPNFQNTNYQNQGSQGLAGYYQNQGYQGQGFQYRDQGFQGNVGLDDATQYTQFSQNIELLD